MGGSGSSSTETTSVNLFAGYEPFVKTYLQTMWNISRDTTLFDYTAPTYAIQNADEIEGLSRLATRATNGSPVIARGETLLRDTFDGTKLNSNPKLDDLFARQKEALIQEFEEETLPRIDSNANLSNAYGSSGHQILQAKAAEAVFSKITSLAYGIYSHGYWAERAIQAASVGLGIPYGNSGVKDTEVLRQVGLYKREYTQGAREDTFKRTRAGVDGRFFGDRHVKRLEILGNAIRTIMGSHVTTVEPLYLPNKFTQIAGIAIAGLSMYGLMQRAGGGGAGGTPGVMAPDAGGPVPTYTQGSSVPHYDL